MAGVPSLCAQRRAMAAATAPMIDSSTTARMNASRFDEYPVALSAAKICLGLLSKRFPETLTTRSFEIPACGTFLLGERTDDHCALFEEGVEAEFFASAEELTDKLRYYLSNPSQRAQIAAAGRERFVRSGYDRVSRFRQMLEIVQAEC